MKFIRNVLPTLALICLVTVGVAFLSPPSSSAGARPTVDGWVISWADDGWYQVQTENGSEEVCSDGTSCDVRAAGYDAGTYKVINHTTGEVWRDVQVPGASDGTDTRGRNAGVRPTVDGWVISWADDGWYQVQTENGSEEVCRAGTSCDVRAAGYDVGFYKVINHTTGQVWPDVGVVGGSYGEDNPPSGDNSPWAWESTSSVGVSWPANSDYVQVQDLDNNYATVAGCEGSTISTCSAPRSGGIYRWQVTNITQGQSWPMQIGEHQPSPPLVVENTIVSTDRGVQLVKNASNTIVCTLDGKGKMCEVDAGTYSVENLVSGGFETVVVLGPTAFNGDTSTALQAEEDKALDDLLGHASPSRPNSTVTASPGQVTLITPLDDGQNLLVTANVNDNKSEITLTYPGGESVSVEVDHSTGEVSGSTSDGDVITGKILVVTEGATIYHRTIVKINGVVVYDRLGDTNFEVPGLGDYCPWDWCSYLVNTPPGGNSGDGSEVNPHEDVLPDGSNDRDGDGTPDAIDVDPNDPNRNGTDRNRNGIVDSQEQNRPKSQEETGRE